MENFEKSVRGAPTDKIYSISPDKNLVLDKEEIDRLSLMGIKSFIDYLFDNPVKIQRYFDSYILIDGYHRTYVAIHKYKLKTIPYEPLVEFDQEDIELDTFTKFTDLSTSMR